MFGCFNEDSLLYYVELLKTKHFFQFSEFNDNWDFTRCVRPDGSAYAIGTGKKCRKGTEKANDEKEIQSKKKKAPTPVKKPTVKSPTNNKKQDEDLKSKYSDLSKKAQEAMVKGDMATALRLNKEAMDVVARMNAAQERKAPDNQEKQQKVEKIASALNKVSAGQDTKVSTEEGSASISNKVGDNEVKTIITPKTDGSYEVGYKVNNSYAKGAITDNREKVRVALMAKRQFEQALAALADGTKVRAVAFDDDGGGDLRRKAYEKLGFKHQGNNIMTGVISNGKVQAMDFAESVNNSKVWFYILFPQG